jgi:hypothetical protein
LVVFLLAHLLACWSFHLSAFNWIPRILSEVEDLNLRGVLVDPGGQETPVRFEGLSAAMPLTGPGSYKLQLVVEAEGYKTVRKSLTFSVIGERPEFGNFDKLKGGTKR